MDYVERKTIEELAALYEFEPTIRDVIVEGADDCSLVQWYAKHRCSRLFSVIEIDAIDVPIDFVNRFGLDVGNRGRVMALSYFLDKTLHDDSRDCVTLIVDNDYDRLLGISCEIEFLLTTDFTCLEMYLFDEDIFDKLISVVLGGATITAVTGLRTLSGVLKRFWLLKITNHVLGFSMSWINFKRTCRISGFNIEFDEETFIDRYLITNGRKREKKLFIQRRDELATQIDQDARHAMDGHHFMELTRWYLRNYVRDRKPLSDQRTFERAFFGCLELSKLDQFELFQSIKARINKA